MRKTCLYCEREGVETELVRVGHWGFCPIHSAKHFVALPAPVATKERLDKAEAERRKG